MTPSHARVAKAMDAPVAVAEQHRPAPPDFVEALFGRVPPEDLRNYSAATLGDLAAAAYEHLRSPRSDDRPDVRLVDVEIERNERRREVTILEVVNDNMPFLLDSTLAEIVDQGYEPLLVALGEVGPHLLRQIRLGEREGHGPVVRVLLHRG